MTTPERIPDAELDVTGYCRLDSHPADQSHELEFTDGWRCNACGVTWDLDGTGGEREAIRCATCGDLYEPAEVPPPDCPKAEGYCSPEPAVRKIKSLDLYSYGPVLYPPTPWPGT